MKGTYKNPGAPKFSPNDAVHIGIKLKNLSKYMGKYQISFMFWGANDNNVLIEKDGIEMYSASGELTPLEIVSKAIDYLERINP